MPKYITFLLLLLAFSTIAQQKIDEELLIFVQKKTDSEFTTLDIQKLEADMKEYNIATKVINIEKTGAPKDIGFTPHIVYRNHLGNKVYKGRYASHQRILNFIRTVRRLPQEDITYEEKNVMVWKHHRANLIFKLKITEPSGHVPENFDKKKFEKDYLLGLKKGFDPANYASQHKITSADEIFYCNFYPYLAEDGKIYISSEIFSHYDCINPVYKQFDNPSVGTNLIEGFTLASTNTFDEIKRQITESKLGDAMNFVTKDIKTIDWKKLKLKTLKAPEHNTQTNVKDIKFPKEWTIAGPVDESTPILAFHFPPPLLQYGGEIKKATGNILLQSEKNLENATGSFVVEVSSLEMGVSSLNNAVKETMLFVSKFPQANLKFRKIRSEDFKLELGKITRTDIEADLTIVDKTATVIATTQFEPILSQSGELLLMVTTQFIAEDLTGSFHIDGPDGPADANNKMYFNANFLMRGIISNE